jgi:putative membrane protein
MPDLLFSVGAFAAYFGAALAMTIIFVMIYIQITPHNETKLIREGNAAAALGLGAAVIGFIFPLTLVISVSHTLGDVVLWGAIALLVQILGHAICRMLMPTLTADIAAGKFSAAIVIATVAIGLGMLQAACWTP